METRSLTDRWRHRLFRILETTDSGGPLKEAALAGKLGDWTKHLTGSVVAACGAMGWRAAAKGHLGDVLPVARNEYLSLDVVAFPESGVRWTFPVAVFELENGKDDAVGYPLWKVLCVRTAPRGVFAYRRDVEEGAVLVGRLTDSLIGGLTIAERLAITTGETSLIIGNRGGADTFPYGYFKAWTLDTNTGRFDRV
jgi:hypothetical protein